MAINNFDDIRAYDDREVKPQLQKLERNSEFQQFMKKLLLKRVNPLQRLVMQLFFKQLWSSFFRRHFHHVTNVEQLQLALKPLIEILFKRTKTQVVNQGFKAINKNLGCLFISNHRDITFDALALSYCLLTTDNATTFNAAGDNLMDREFVEILLRLNKTFIVLRGQNQRNTLINASKLSNYIEQLRQQGHNIWLSQRSGRAKDGEDTTHLNVLKMLYMSAAKTTSFQQHLTKLQLTPMAISYEWDPCDADKAIELEMRSKNENYTKSEDEDFLSICKGLFDYKGKINIQIASPITTDNINDLEQLAEHIDNQIASMYYLFASNYASYQLLGNSLQGLTIPYSTEQLEQAKMRLLKRTQNLSKTATQFLLEAYAKPVIAKLN